jgi:site-specific DNA-methyltransferase (adenine-specific)
MNDYKIYSIDKEGNYCLIQGNSLKFMSDRKAESVNCIFADPPYFLTADRNHPSYKGDWDLSKGAMEDFTFHYTWIKEAYRLLKPDGVIWITGTQHNIHQCGYALQLAGFHIINDIAWNKPRETWSKTTNSLAYTHETILFAKKSRKARIYLNQKLLYTPQDKFHKEGNSMPTIWDIKPASFKEVQGHKTPKPVELLKRILLLSTQPNDVILDPFNGSGTTGVATLQLGAGRKYIGVDLALDIDEKGKNYLDLTINRLEAVKSLKQQNKPYNGLA